MTATETLPIEARVSGLTPCSARLMRGQPLAK
jgi:hypothetical protein